MIEPSPELVSVMRRYLEAFQDRDVPAIRALTDSADHTLIIGSDPREWHKAGRGVDLAAIQIEEMAEFEYVFKRIEAFHRGAVGWAAAEVTARFESGFDVDLRFTAVFELQEGVWRVVHWHASIPQEDDPKVIGEKLSGTMTRLLDSIDSASELTDLREQLRTSTVTLVFTDIEDSTLRSNQAGDAEWTETITNHFAAIARIAEDDGGVVVKTLGDGAMLAFGSARSALDAALAIVEAAEAVEGEPLRLRVGVHTGEAVKTDTDYFGQAVNKAARIAASAEPGQILVSEVVRSLVGEMPAVSFGEPLHLQLKGIPDLQTVFALVKN
jgi:adenylate cyclase